MLIGKPQTLPALGPNQPTPICSYPPPPEGLKKKPPGHLRRPHDDGGRAGCDVGWLAAGVRQCGPEHQSLVPADPPGGVPTPAPPPRIFNGPAWIGVSKSATPPFKYRGARFFSGTKFRALGGVHLFNGYKNRQNGITLP